VLDGESRLLLQSVLVTGTAAILNFIHGIKATLHVTFEEGAQSAWLY
jgi:hypothetical protein